MPLPLGVMLVTVSLSMPHETCNLSRSFKLVALQLLQNYNVPSCLCLWESCW
ncbi:unnamed protein product [Staurois parvus]|uniref:Uncharacterized protein n=1 Tax=Staurois parvus TaxID=386267 RepID=A0ABN9FBK3_9NEOB|nr:unnamed protein product [Staurois parvus]